jgi:hypothetical protein
VTLRRYSPLRSKAQRDPVSSEARAAVLRRDRECIAARLGFLHECRDAFGTPHAPNATGSLTVEHVKDGLAMGQRAPSDPAHMVALCYSRNVAVPSKAMRVAFREYLSRVTT